jgi:hypothetical protein
VTALEEYPFHGEVGPSLDGVGARWDEAALRGIIVNAKAAFPDTVMPSFYRVSGFTRPGNAFTGRAAEGRSTRFSGAGRRGCGRLPDDADRILTIGFDGVEQGEYPWT